MTKTEIGLKYLNGVIVSPSNSNNETAALSITAQMMALGYIPSQELLDVMKTMDVESLVDLYAGVIPAIRKFRGADVQWEPMYPNFPQQVMDMSEADLLISAIRHYWLGGIWKPTYTKLPREFKFEFSNFQKVEVIDQNQFDQIFPKLLQSADSISETDKETIKWFLENESDLVYPEAIPFKENLCFLAGMFLEKRVDIQPLIKTATDILRVATHLSGGDISLGSNTKFKSFSRYERRVLINTLEEVIREEDIERHRNKWKKLFHELHVGEHFWNTKVIEISNKVRNNEPIHTFNGKVEIALEANDTKEIIKLLKTRPGEFARRLDHVVRISDDKNKVVKEFLSVSSKVPTRVMLQVLGNLKIRSTNVEKRIVFPKGSIAKAVKVLSSLDAIDDKTLQTLKSGIEAELMARFSKLEPLGKVYIDPLLKGCPVPTQMRNASESTFTVARGTRMPIGHPDQKYLVTFLHWIGDDIDLSASFFDENLELSRIGDQNEISFRNLKVPSIEAVHSGDIRHAPKPNGGVELISINMDLALAAGIRYIVSDTRIYSGPPTFGKHERCFTGWMTKEFTYANEIFDPKLVRAKVEVKSEARVATPVVFDLLTREAIWTDLSSSLVNGAFDNSTKANRASVKEVLESIINIDNRTSLYDLFKLHAQARGTIVEAPEEAEQVYSLYDGITPYNIMEINSSYIG